MKIKFALSTNYVNDVEKKDSETICEMYKIDVKF